MLIEHKQKLTEFFSQAVKQFLLGQKDSDQLLPQSFTVDFQQPKQTSHGDVTCLVGFQLSRLLGLTPLAIATKIAELVQSSPEADAFIESLDVLKPGFINIWMTTQSKHSILLSVLSQSCRFGCNSTQKNQKVILEFVSANPTGPLHVGHARQAVLGDVLAELLGTCGWEVMKEFYYNDAGTQIDHLIASVRAHLEGITPESDLFPKDGYRGDYVKDIAEAFRSGATVGSVRVPFVTANSDSSDEEAIRAFSVAYLRCEQEIDLESLGVVFDSYYLESSLYKDGLVEATVKNLVQSGKTYEEEGALWLRTTDYGDDKDRVMRKSGNSEGAGYTYFVPDVAYHVTKWKRGFTRAINIQGSDHHSTISRVRAGLAAVGAGVPANYPEYILHKMVTVIKEGQEVKISKRSGSYVTVRDLILWSGGQSQEDKKDNTNQLEEKVFSCGLDAVRFFLASRKADTEFVFDVDLAIQKNDENPVYYVQYAYARICSVVRQWGGLEEDLRQRFLSGIVSCSSLRSPKELSLMKSLAHYCEVLAVAEKELAPHVLVFYVRSLAGEFHSYYNACRILEGELQMIEAKLVLILAVKQVFLNVLKILGVSAPERM